MGFMNFIFWKAKDKHLLQVSQDNTKFNHVMLPLFESSMAFRYGTFCIVYVLKSTQLSVGLPINLLN